MEKQEVIKAYFQKLEKRSRDGILELFTPSAVIYSPMYEQQPNNTSDFFKELFSTFSTIRAELKSVFVNAKNSHSLAAHYTIISMMQSQTLIQFEGVNIFELNKETNKIAHLTIIYATVPTFSE